MSDYRRSYIPGGCWLLTVNLQNRHSDLLTWYIAHLRAVTAFVKSKKSLLINAWAVLPEHIHCIWIPSKGDASYSGRWRDIKKMFIRALAQRHIWQPYLWEHATRSEEDHRRHMDYVYVNPVKHGHARRAQGWPYSTLYRGVRWAWYPPGWVGEVSEFDTGERR